MMGPRPIHIWRFEPEQPASSVISKSAGLTLIVWHISRAHWEIKGGKRWTRDCIPEHVSFQSWTQNGARGYWSVDLEPAAASQPDIECSPRRRERVERVLDEEVRHLNQQDHRRNMTDTGIGDLASTSI